MYMVDVEIPPAESRQGEKFIGPCYPGSLVGRALGFNFKHGFAWSMNAVTPVHQRAGIRNLTVFRTKNCEQDVLLTLATGIFNIEEGYFHLYTENSRTALPSYTIDITPKDCLSNTFM